MTPSPRQCFVIGPIGGQDSEIRTHSDWLLDGIIRPVFKEHFNDFAVVRADKITAPGMIDAQIINRLLDDHLVIADMTALNANAFYEIGIRHMIEKPIVHMFRVDTEIPFDVKPYRAIPFRVAKPSDLTAAQSDLRDAVTEAIDPEFKIDNPVTRARGTLHLKQSATPEMQILLDRVTEIQIDLDKFKGTRSGWHPNETGRDGPFTPANDYHIELAPEATQTLMSQQVLLVNTACRWFS